MSAVHHTAADGSGWEHERVRWVRASSIGLYAVFGLLAIAALAKLADLPAFRESLESWELVPRSIRGMLAVVVPACELVVAGLWLMSIARPLALRLGLVLMVVLTAAYTAHWLLVGPPECSCLGRLLEYETTRRSWKFVIGRNTVLLVLLTAGLVVDRRQSRAARRRDTNDAA